jgi:hypothetical protein
MRAARRAMRRILRSRFARVWLGHAWFGDAWPPFERTMRLSVRVEHRTMSRNDAALPPAPPARL